MAMHHLSMTEGWDEFDPTDYEDPWYEQHLDEWAERLIGARIAEDAAVGLDAGPFETWEAA
jgi:hypothetical protein